MKRKLIYATLCLLLCGGAYAQKKTVVRDHTYRASDADSKITARANAATQLRTILLREVGEFVHAERTFSQRAYAQDYAEKVEAIAAGIVEMKILDERWDGATYYIKAQMTVDPKDLERRIAEVLNDKQKTKELEEARRRTQAAEAETERLRRELAKTKSEQQRLVLEKNYQKATNMLSAEEYFTQGYNAREGGFHKLAIEYYQKAIAIDPTLAGAYNNMGNAYARLENHREAIKCYQKAVAIDPNYAMAYNNMGVAYYNELENYHEAIKYYQKAIAIDPTLAVAYYNMGVAYHNLENYREAIKCYQKAVAIDPNYASAYYNMGSAYDDLQNYYEAIKCYQKAVAIDPTLAVAYTNMGSAYARLGNKQEQIKCYQQAARLGDQDAQKWLRENGYSW